MHKNSEKFSLTMAIFDQQYLAQDTLQRLAQERITKRALSDVHFTH